MESLGTGGVDGKNVDFAENVHNVGFIVNGYRWFYFIGPSFPIEFIKIIIVIITGSLFREFLFRNWFPDSAEVFHVFFIILASSSYCSSDSPDTGKQEYGFIADFEVFSDSIFVVDVSVLFEICLKTSEENEDSGGVNFRAFD